MSSSYVAAGGRGALRRAPQPAVRRDLLGDGATALVEFWQRVDPATASSTTSPTPRSTPASSATSTRTSRRRPARSYALLQTPVFVEEFILDRTLTPAIEEFGLDRVRAHRPGLRVGPLPARARSSACSATWQRREPGPPHANWCDALDRVHGVDLNPFAVPSRASACSSPL